MLEQANLFHFSGTLTIDTNLGIIEHSDGSIHYGLIEDRSYLHTDGTVWPDRSVGMKVRTILN